MDWTSGDAVNLWIDATNVGEINLTPISDRRAKHDIHTLTGGLERIMALRPVAFQYRKVGRFKNDDAVHHSFVADELQKVIPTAVNGQPDAVDTEGKPKYQTLNPEEIIPDLVQAVQDLKRQIGADQKEITRLKKAKRHG
jgi:hypothetical protein